MKSFFAFLAVLVLTAAPTGVAARPIPAEAKEVRLTMAGNGTAFVGESRHRISAAAQFRDLENRTVVPASLRGEYRARVIIDRNGDLWRVWLMRPKRERAGPILP